jgi:hypothetical protein
MALTFRGDGVIVDWVNNMGIPRLRGQLVVDNLLIGYAMEDIMPIGHEIFIRNQKPVGSSGAVCRCGIIEYPIHLQKAVTPWQPAYYNPAIDMITDSPGALANIPRPATGNIGNTTVSPVAVSDDTLSEQWILECVYQNSQTGASVWRLAGTYSGTISDSIPSGDWWYSPRRNIGLRITHGTIPPQDTDRFTFFTNQSRTKVGMFMYGYPASVQYGTVVLPSKIPLKDHIHGKNYI